MWTRTSTLSARLTVPEANAGARVYGRANGIASTAVMRTVPIAVVAVMSSGTVGEVDAASNTNHVSINHVSDMNRALAVLGVRIVEATARVPLRALIAVRGNPAAGP